MPYYLEDTIPFGMFKGMTIKDAIASGPRGKSWISWACSNAKNFSVDQEVTDYMKTGKLPKPKKPTELDFWQKIIINGKEENVPF